MDQGTWHCVALGGGQEQAHMKHRDSGASKSGHRCPVTRRGRGRGRGGQADGRTHGVWSNGVGSSAHKQALGREILSFPNCINERAWCTGRGSGSEAPSGKAKPAVCSQRVRHGRGDSRCRGHGYGTGGGRGWDVSGKAARDAQRVCCASRWYGREVGGLGGWAGR